MRIAWFCIPAHGHTNPTLGLVKEMTKAGHEVVYFSFEQFREKIEQVGATFVPCDAYDLEIRDEDAADRVGKDVAFATEVLVNSTLALDDMVAKKVSEIKPDLIVSEYIRNRRLSLAGRDLQIDGCKVIDVAMKYGYDSPDSFTKAFTRFHGITPTQAKNGEGELRNYLPLKIHLS